MKVIACRNVHQALPIAMKYLDEYGIRRNSRNGPVLVSPEPVATAYLKPTERVIFWPERDANPAFHLYESLWMLAGRNDVAPLTRYVKRMENFSDDGRTLHGAYGYRWRRQWCDQLEYIATELKTQPDSRRCVLQMWGANEDLGRTGGKDVPCNLMATFQRDLDGKLDIVVFNRSNDIVWGAYGANAVQFSMLQEFMAAAIECPVGRYTQASVNWHAYIDTFEGVKSLTGPLDPYAEGLVRTLPLGEHAADIERNIDHLLIEADTGFVRRHTYSGNEFFENAYRVLYAHDLFRTLAAPEKYDAALEVIDAADQTVDWVVAMKEWLLRRKASWETKLVCK